MSRRRERAEAFLDLAKLKLRDVEANLAVIVSDASHGELWQLDLRSPLIASRVALYRFLVNNIPEADVDD